MVSIEKFMKIFRVFYIEKVAVYLIYIQCADKADFVFTLEIFACREFTFDIMDGFFCKFICFLISRINRDISIRGI